MKGTRPPVPRRGRSGTLAAARDVVSIFGEVGRMIWARRLWWLIPMFVSLTLVGALVLLGSSPIAPAFYPLF